MRIFLVAILCFATPAFRAQEAGDPGENTRRNPYLELGSRFHFTDTGDPLEDWNPVRVWTATDGRTVKAKLQGWEGESGSFLLPGNRVVRIPFSRLSDEDRTFIREWKEMSRFFDLGYRPSRNVTNTIQAGISDGAIAKEGTVHETAHFRFECDQPLNVSVVKDFSQMFEATHAMVKALPLALEVADPRDGKFLVRLFADKDDYHRAGGPRQAAGVYIIRSREILIPLASLGVKRSGRTFRKASEYDPSTLIHETVHAVTHQWIQYMPMWIVEGLAEYVASIPYKNGTFFLDRHPEGLRGMVTSNFGGNPNRFPLLRPEEFVFLSKDEFMQRASDPERQIELTAIEPFQIRLVGEEEPPGQDSPAGPSSSNSTSVPAKTTPVPAPVGVTIDHTNPGPIVVQRYSSSMLLLHHLLSTGQEANLRKYLFAHLHFEWDSEKYIEDYNRSLESYQTEVKEQIAEFESVLDRFNESVRSYNRVVQRKNAGEDVPLPGIPEKPTVPAPVAVPDILAHPRARENFSRAHFRRVCAERFLELPSSLSL